MIPTAEHLAYHIVVGAKEATGGQLKLINHARGRKEGRKDGHETQKLNTHKTTNQIQSVAGGLLVLALLWNKSALLFVPCFNCST